MLLKTLGLALVSLLELLILLDLVAGLSVVQHVGLWLALHVALVMCGTLLLSQILLSTTASASAANDTAADNTAPSDEFQVANEGAGKESHFRLVVLIGLLGVMVPGVGLTGVALSLLYGLYVSRTRTYVTEYWQVTPLASLPYVAPKGRKSQALDGRGFSEHLLYGTDKQDIYCKVLASANVRTSLAINTLKQAMQHSDERVRLTAYKTLDKKVTALNKQIQALEKSVEEHEDSTNSDRWLQIASNYWELTTLEGGEAVARRQLLANAAAAAIKAVEREPGNRNAHLVLGRVFLAQGDARRAAVALERSHTLGMPADKVIPYLAECAYVNRDFSAVQSLLACLDPAIVSYPPLSHVAGYWK